MAHGESAGGFSVAPPLQLGLRINLSVMMFLQFAIWGAWYVVLGNYIAAMQFKPEQIGSIYATMSLGAIISPIIIGQIADRYFSSERLMAVLHLGGAAILWYLAQISDPQKFYWITLGYALVYSPTLALSNSIAFTHIPNATRDFPSIRVLGTIGWIAVGFLVTWLLYMLANRPEVASSPAPKFMIAIGGTSYLIPVLLAAVLSFLLGVYSLFLPHTPPKGKPGDALPFLKAVGLMRDPSFAVFFGTSFIITIVLAFYYNWTGIYLGTAQQVKEENISSLMAIGQVAEMVLLPLLPIFLFKFGMKWVLALGMFSWGLRYVFFSLGEPYALVLIGIALHGICFDFFFAAGFIHVDNKAPRDIRASGQALFSFLTYGVGMFLGGELSGYVAKWFTNESTKATDWRSFWLVPAVGVFLSFAIFVLFFRDRREAVSLDRDVDLSRRGVTED